MNDQIAQPHGIGLPAAGGQFEAGPDLGERRGQRQHALDVEPRGEKTHIGLGHRRDVEGGVRRDDVAGSGLRLAMNAGVAAPVAGDDDHRRSRCIFVERFDLLEKTV